MKTTKLAFKGHSLPARISDHGFWLASIGVYHATGVPFPEVFLLLVTSQATCGQKRKKYYVNKQNLHANEEFSAKSSQKCTTQECFCFESEKIGI